MYDVTNKSKMELVEEICRSLREHGINDETYSVKSSFSNGLMHMPIENLQKIVQCEVSDWSSFSKVYNAWGRAGALRFTPYVDDEHDNPTLVVRHNRYIHMFRGYNFQASGTIDGINDHGSGCYRTDFLTRVGYYNKVLVHSVLSDMLWWAALIDVGFKYDNFVSLFNEDVSVIEKFLSASKKHWTGEEVCPWNTVKEYISMGDGSIDYYARTVYQLEWSDKEIAAYIAIGEKTVQVEVAGNKLITVTIPTLSDGAGYNLEDEYGRDCFDDEMDILERNHFREMILVMACNLIGIHIDFIGFYFQNVAKEMRPINWPGVFRARNLNDIYGKDPDKF